MKSILAVLALFTTIAASAADYQAITYPVAADSSKQPAMVQWATKPGQPLLVGLHSWSADYKQSKGKTYAAECAKRDWNLIFPNFRGPNKTPQACGSELVVADILAAVDYAVKEAKADPKRVYLLGESGGGYATLLMAARHPERFAAASAWVPIYDLVAWHAENKVAKRKYYKMIEGATGGPPGTSPEVDKQYKIRSVKHWLEHGKVKNLPIHVNVGIHDGYTGSVPVTHSLNAFNAMAAPVDRLTEDQIKHFRTQRSVPPELTAERVVDPGYQKPILFRRTSGNATLTVFDGGHQSFPIAGISWLSQQK